LPEYCEKLQKIAAGCKVTKIIKTTTADLEKTDLEKGKVKRYNLKN
jgi:hypothetical protein